MAFTKIVAADDVTYELPGLVRQNFVRSPNYVMNGAFEINQRNFTSITADGFTFDRWQTGRSGGTVTASKQAFTPGAAPITGYESENFHRIVTSGQSASNSYSFLRQNIESVRTLAGQSATLSFWAKASSAGTKVGIYVAQAFGTGGSPDVVALNAAVTLSTSWQRYTVSAVFPSISGKTIGAGDNLALYLWTSVGSSIISSGASAIGLQNATVDFWGVQLEEGNVATPFRRNANSIQGELAACQRYYYRVNSGPAFTLFASGKMFSTTTGNFYIPFPVQMRTTVSALDSSAGSTFRIETTGAVAVSSLSMNNLATSSTGAQIDAVASSALTAGHGAVLQGNNTTSAFLGFSAEL